MKERDTQPFKFEFILANGEKITGGAETKALCIDHVQYCLRDSHTRDDNKPHRIVSAYYLGRKSHPVRKQVTA